MNSDHYLQQVASIVRDHFRSNDPSGSMTAATVGYLARQATGHGPEVVGFAKFKDALRELERRAAIRVGVNSKGALAVWLSTATSPNDELAAAPPQAGPLRHHASRYLRNPVWLAFVSNAPPGRRFINRETGDIRLNQETEPEPKPLWVEINPVPETVQRDWALKCLRDEGHENDLPLLEALDSPRWFSDLPAAMRLVDFALETSWKRRRSQMVVAHVADWCSKNELPESVVFQQSGDDARPGPHSGEGGLRELRQSLIAAVRRMSTDELIRLRIPAKHLIAVLRPDLLDD